MSTNRVIATDGQALAATTKETKGAATLPATRDGLTGGASLRAKSRVKITNPDTGNTYTVRRPTTQSMIKSGHLPDDFFYTQAGRLFADQQAAPGDNPAEGEETPEENRDLSGFKDQNLLRVEAITRAIVTASLFWPRVVERVEDEADESVVEYDDIPASDRDYIRAWYEYRLEESTVALKDGGEVKTGEVKTFPAGEQAGQPDRARTGGAAGQ